MITSSEPTSVDQVAIKPTYNAGYVWTISLVAAMGGLLFGYDWVVISGAKPFYEAFFQLDSGTAEAWATSCALLGCLLGAIVAGTISDRFGRKYPLILAALMFAVTSVGNGLAQSFTVFVIWRMLGGVAIGLASNLSPTYIAEVAPAQVRGRLVGIYQLTIVIGILLAQSVNYAISYGLPTGLTTEAIRISWYGEWAWRYMFIATAAPSLLFLVGMFVVPESPRWMAQHGAVGTARKILERIGGGRYAEAALADMELTTRGGTSKVDYGVLLEPRMLKVLGLGVGLAVLQQWCGINVIFYYATDIFKDAGYDIADGLKNIAWIGSVNLVFTLVALAVVDRIGRRPLMLLGFIGLAVVYVVMAVCSVQQVKGAAVLILVLVAIACYACTLAPVVWVVIAEIFPNRIRGAAVSVAVSALWIACFLLSYTFPILRDWLGLALTYGAYGVICVVGFVFVLVYLQETKGKSLEEIEEALVGTSKAFPVVTVDSPSQGQ